MLILASLPFCQVGLKLNPAAALGFTQGLFSSKHPARWALQSQQLAVICFKRAVEERSSNMFLAACKLCAVYMFPLPGSPGSNCGDAVFTMGIAKRSFSPSMMAYEKEYSDSEESTRETEDVDFAERRRLQKMGSPYRAWDRIANLLSLDKATLADYESLTFTICSCNSIQLPAQFADNVGTIFSNNTGPIFGSLITFVSGMLG